MKPQIVALVVVAASSLGIADAQTAPKPQTAAPTVQSVTRTAPAVQIVSRTADGYTNADAVRGLFNGRPFMPFCGNGPVVGPAPTPAPGSVESQPGYQFLQDFDRMGSCRKGI